MIVSLTSGVNYKNQQGAFHSSFLTEVCPIFISNKKKSQLDDSDDDTGATARAFVIVATIPPCPWFLSRLIL